MNVTPCGRGAWLTLGALSVPLQDDSAGYFLESLDLGFPKPREVIDNLSDRNGALDRTSLSGPRVVTASVHAVESAGTLPLDGLGSLFAPFMDPAARPVLHYVLARGGGAERTLTLRAADFSWPITGPYDRVVALQWIASDPVAYGTTQQVQTAWSGSSAAVGRGYDWTPPRQYPAGGGSASTATIRTYGELPARPYFRIFGPITGAMIYLQPSGGTPFYMPLVAQARIDAGHFLGIDSRMHTAYLDDNPAQPWLSQIDWTRWVWPSLPTDPASTLMSLNGNNTSGATQVSATWTEAYMT